MNRKMQRKIFVRIDGKPNADNRSPFTIAWWGFNPSFNRNSFNFQCFFADLDEYQKRKEAEKKIIVPLSSSEFAQLATLNADIERNMLARKAPKGANNDRQADS